ncbi:MAG: glycosyltransferase family 2 protein [Acidobacteria bacterium]|nr:glycosyltransferase family 2 protein [Acidobacteriota bacterium]
MFSVVIPVYRNEESLPELVEALASVAGRVSSPLEAVFVVDGSPDQSLRVLHALLPRAPFPSQVVALSRNFGSFAAIRAGLAAGKGEAFGVVAADLQEPPELLVTFHDALARGEADVVVGTRAGRSDPLFSRVFSGAFWGLYRRLVLPDIPPGGVDVFGCTRAFRDQLLAIEERNTSLVGLLFWLGFRRLEVPYERRERRHGSSAWSFRKRIRYLLDATFAFSDLPIRLVSLIGLAGIAASLVLGAIVLWAKLQGDIPIPGYAATVLTVMFFGGLNSLALGLVGEYVWRVFENTKARPNYVVAVSREFPGERRGSESA